MASEDIDLYVRQPLLAFNSPYTFCTRHDYRITVCLGPYIRLCNGFIVKLKMSDTKLFILNVGSVQEGYVSKKVWLT